MYTNWDCELTMDIVEGRLPNKERRGYLSILMNRLRRISGKSVQSEYMEWNNLAEILQPGDLIEFGRGMNSAGVLSRGTYQHWAIFEGLREGVPYVIHLTTSTTNGKGEVKSDPLENASKGRLGRKNNGKDRTWRPLQVNQILEQARKMLETVNYHVLDNNCEHFVHSCRYGEKFSMQVCVANFVCLCIIVLPVPFLFFLTPRADNISISYAVFFVAAPLSMIGLIVNLQYWFTTNRKVSPLN
ncbi:hypothetical protein PMAYCL1PPCAC_26400, partial [Pristionchus mayeri]